MLPGTSAVRCAEIIIYRGQIAATQMRAKMRIHYIYIVHRSRTRIITYQLSLWRASKSLAIRSSLGILLEINAKANDTRTPLFDQPKSRKAFRCRRLTYIARILVALCVSRSGKINRQVPIASRASLTRYRVSLARYQFPRYVTRQKCGHSSSASRMDSLKLPKRWVLRWARMPLPRELSLDNPAPGSRTPDSD